MKTTLPALAALVLLSACEQSAQDTGRKLDTVANEVTEAGRDVVATVNEAAADVVDAVDGVRSTDAWIGKWTGVEGLALDVQKGNAEGKYALKVTLLDGTNDYEGAAAGDTITFVRDGKTETIRKTDGAATGLKYLAEKKDCLTIKSGEGFCRD